MHQRAMLCIIHDTELMVHQRAMLCIMHVIIHDTEPLWLT